MEKYDARYFERSSACLQRTISELGITCGENR